MSAVVVLAALAAAAGCRSSSSPAQPSATDTTITAGLTASIAAPRPLTPANAARIRFVDQPITLVVQNAITTAASGVTYAFEVASDAAFANKVQTKDGIAQGVSGQTSVALDSLPGGQDYWWHARATGGGTTGIFLTSYKFTVGPAITVNAPVPIGPLNGAQTDLRPVLRVANATRSGPAGPLTYRFDVATSGAFTTVVVSGTNVEGVNETGFVIPNNLAPNTTFYWRAFAFDEANGVSSGPSSAQSFTTSGPSQAAIVAAQLGMVLWPGNQPPGTTGHAVMGNFWNVTIATSFDGVRFLNPPLDEVQVFDLLDRGFDPQGALDWMHSHGYSTSGAYYQSVQVIGFQFEYMALINGQWDIVLKVGA